MSTDLFHKLFAMLAKSDQRAFLPQIEAKVSQTCEPYFKKAPENMNHVSKTIQKREPCV